MKRYVKSKLEIIQQLQDGNLTPQDCMSMLNESRVWDTSPDPRLPGCLAIFALKNILTAFPIINTTTSTSSPKTTLTKYVLDMDQKLCKILNELRSNDVDNTVDWDETNKPGYNFFVDNAKFRVFGGSLTYIRLFEQMFREFQLIKTHELLKGFKNRLDRKKHVETLVFYAAVFKHIMNSLFVIPTPIPIVYIAILDTITVTSAKVRNVIKQCMQVPNFKLDLQYYLVQFCLSDIDLQMYKYRNRLDFTREHILSEFPRYVHIMADLMESIYPEQANKILDIHNPKMDLFTMSLDNNLMKFINDVKTGKVWKLDIFDTLYLEFVIKVYIEKTIKFRGWSKLFKCENLEELSERRKGTQFPIIVRIYQILLGVFWRGVIYFGDVFHVYSKYAEIINTNYDGRIWDSLSSHREYDFTNFFLS